MERWIIGAAALLALLVGLLVGAWNAISSRLQPTPPATEPRESTPLDTTSEPKALQPAPGAPDEDASHDRSGARPLFENFQSPEWRVRFLAAKALDDRDKLTRRFASVSILRMGTVAIPHLARYIEDEKRGMRIWPREALASYGPTAEEALPPLRKTTQETRSELSATPLPQPYNRSRPK